MSLNLYSLIETCKANNVDVYQYLIDLFKALPLSQTKDLIVSRSAVAA